MARRIDIELTSVRDDGTWTWRAAGAKEPRGALDAKLLEDDAKVGDVLKVEASFGLDGITIVSVLQSRERSEPKGRLEILASPTDGAGSVTTELISRRRGEGRARPEREGRRPSGDDRRRRPGGPPRTEGVPDTRRHERPARVRTPRPDTGSVGTERRRASVRVERPSEKPKRSRPARFVPGTKHRDEYLATLPPEERAVAEQLARAGMPAIRRAVAEARGSGGHGGDAMIALAEQLQPDVRRATWLDRAEAAVAQLESISLRDLRATVVGATPRDDHGREMLGTLREALSARVAKIRTTWETEITHALEGGRVLQALRLSARAPDAGARLPSALAKPLADAASTALDATAPPERWLALLEAAAASPVRLSVKPAAMPADESGSLRQSAAAWAGRIPALGPMLGLALPPPPRPVRRPASDRPRRQPHKMVASPQPAKETDNGAAGEAADSATARSDDAPVEVVTTEPLEDSTADRGVEETAEEVREPEAPHVEEPESQPSAELTQDTVVDEPQSDSVDEV